MADQPILIVVADAHTTHCLTEELLDTWWASLPGGFKAEIYEAALEGSDPSAQIALVPVQASPTATERSTQ